MFSKPYINKMLQRTSAETLPMQLNSVRHIEPYQGSVNPQDLLDLYVGNTHYRQINKALRAPNIQTAQQQVWDEADLMQPKSYYAGLPEQYQSLMSSFDAGYQNQDAIKQFVSNSKNDAFDILELTPDHQLASIPSNQNFKYHPLSYTPGFSELPLQQQAEKVIDYELPERTMVQPSSVDRGHAQHYLNQVLASAPHIEQTVLNQPVHELQQSVVSSPVQLNKYFANKFDNYLAKTEATGNKEPDFSTNVAIQNYLKPSEQEELGLFDDEGDYIPDKVHSYISSLRNGDTTPRIVNYPISRGLHFNNDTDYSNFINQHEPGQVIEYPAFTSTTTLPNIQEGFASERIGETPVYQSFSPSTNTNQYNAYDVNNPGEGERLYPPGQRFKVISNDGTNIALQETNEPTAIEQRTQGILSRMKPRLANLQSI